jgi:hypothetical protein
MKTLVLIASLLIAATALAQPFPLPNGPPSASSTTYDQQGRKHETVRGQNGWTTYGPDGKRYDSFPTHTGGTVTYGPQGSKWETIPGPASAFPVQRTGR